MTCVPSSLSEETLSFTEEDGGWSGGVQQQVGCASPTAGAGSESGGVGEGDSSEVHAETIFQAKAIAMEAIRLAMQQTPDTDVGSDPNLVARNAVREAMVSASGGFIAGHQAVNVGDPSNHDRKVQAFACDMLQTAMDRSSRVQTPASVALGSRYSGLVVPWNTQNKFLTTNR